MIKDLEEAQATRQADGTGKNVAPERETESDKRPMDEFDGLNSTVLTMRITIPYDDPNPKDRRSYFDFSKPHLTRVADYGPWLAKPEWTLYEAYFLSSGYDPADSYILPMTPIVVEPSNKKWSYHQFYNPSAQGLEICVARLAIRHAVKGFLPARHESTTDYPDLLKLSDFTVEPLEFLRWFSEQNAKGNFLVRGLALPEPLQAYLDSHKEAPKSGGAAKKTSKKKKQSKTDDDVRMFQVPTGTQWPQVKIKFTNDKTDAHDKSLAAPKNTYNPLQLLTLDEISP